MKKVGGKKMRGPTLQEIELLPITDPVVLEMLDRRLMAAKKGEEDELLVMPPWDPAEKAEFDRRCKEAEEAMAAAARDAGKRKTPKRK